MKMKAAPDGGLRRSGRATLGPSVVPVIARRLNGRTGPSRGDPASRARRPGAKLGSVNGCVHGCGPLPGHCTPHRPYTWAWEDLLVWSVVIPVKRLPDAKSRLAPLSGEVRAALALAFASDAV